MPGRGQTPPLPYRTRSIRSLCSCRVGAGLVPALVKKGFRLGNGVDQRGRNTGGQGEGEATALSGDACAFRPDAASHRLYHLFADVESQAATSHRPGNIAFEAHE